MPPKKKSVNVLAKKAAKKVIKKAVSKEMAILKPNAGLMPVHGHGGYFSDFFSNLGNNIGGKFGDIGAAIGKGAGGWLGDKLSKITGFGKYKIKGNTFMKGDNFEFDEGSKEPTFEYEPDGGIVVTHREFLGVLNSSGVMVPTGGSSTGFSGRYFIVNPTNSACFPWFHIMALMYQNWEPLGLMFQTKRLVGSTAANAAGAVVNNPGEVFASSLYDILGGLAESLASSNNLPFANQTDMENTEFTQDHSATEDFYHPLECDPAQRPTKIMTCNMSLLSTYNNSAGTGSIASAANQINTLCLTQFASVAAPQVNQPLQELFVIYKIRLSKPLIKFAPVTKFLHMRASTLASVVDATPLGAATSTTLPLSARLASGSTLIPTSVTTSTGSILNFSSESFSIGEKFEVILHWLGTAANVAYPVATFGTGLELLPYYNAGVDSFMSAPNNGVSSTTLMLKFMVLVNESISQTRTTFIKLGTATLPTALTNFELHINSVRRIVGSTPAY